MFKPVGSICNLKCSYCYYLDKQRMYEKESAMSVEVLEKCIKEYYPGTEVKIEHAEGLADCKKALLLAKAGKKNGYLIEGMGCPGGCIAGAGTNIPIANAQKCLAEFVKNSSEQIPPKELEEIELK